MSSTNKTTYYELPQFVDNDIFNPLVDDNDAYNKIDTALHNIANAEADDASEIDGIKSRLDGAEGDIDAIEAQNGSETLTTTAQTLSGAVNELDADASSLDGRLDIVEDDIDKRTAYVTPEMFGAVGDGVADDTQALSNAINYGYTNHIPVKIKKVKITDTIRFRGDVSGGIIILADNANIITSSDITDNINIHNIEFDVSNFSGVAITVKSCHTNIYNCAFKGITTPSNVICIKAIPYTDASEEFYVNTYRGLWGLHFTENFFYGVNTCFKITTPNVADAWISDCEITNNSGFYHYYSVDIEGGNADNIHNISGIILKGNAFSDNYTSETIRYGLKVKDANGKVSSMDDKFFSDGDDVNYYGMYVQNALSEKLTEVNEGDDYYNLVNGRGGKLYLNHGTDGKTQLIQGMTLETPWMKHPSLIGIAKNLLFNNNIDNVGTAITYSDNQLTFTHTGSVTNAQVTIPIPAELNNNKGKFYYLGVCDFDTSFSTGHRPDITTVNGVIVTRGQSLPFPGTKYLGKTFGGCCTISTEFENSIKLRFLNFPAGTYVIKHLIVFNSFVSDLPKFTNNFADLSMFDY